MKKLVAIVALVLLAVAGGAFWVLRSRGVVLNGAEVERTADRLLPGARPPQGLRGVLALQPDGLEVAIFAKGLPQAQLENLGSGDLRIIIARPEASQTPRPEEIAERISRAQQKKAEELDTLQQHPAVVSVGGRPYPATEADVRLRSNGRALQETLVLLPGPVIVLLTGDGAQATRDQFLASLPAAQGPVPGSETPKPARPIRPASRPRFQTTPPPRPRLPEAPPGLPGPPP